MLSKKGILFLLSFWTITTVAVYSIISCGSNSKQVTKKLFTRDSTLTVIQYSYNWTINDHRTSVAMRIEYDTLTPDTANPTKNVWSRYQEYQVPIPAPVLDSVTKKPKRDGLGREVQELKWAVLPKDLLLVDYNKNYKLKK